MSDQFHLFAPGNTARLRTRQRELPGFGLDGGLRLCVLGSGSGGNSSVVMWQGRAMLIDAGFGPRSTKRKLAAVGVDFEQVDAICLTHLDQDHFRRTWARVLRDRGIRLHVHRGHVDEVLRLEGMSAEVLDVFDDALEPLAGLHGRTVMLKHDQKGTVGYRFDAGSLKDAGSIGYATDLGHAPAELIELFGGVSLVCLESNYDEAMTLNSSRPMWLNRRNLSDGGHLSNEQAFEAVCLIDEISPGDLPHDVVLMHPSQQCNHPREIASVFERHAGLASRVTLTQQRTPTRWLEVGAARAKPRAAGIG